MKNKTTIVMIEPQRHKDEAGSTVYVNMLLMVSMICESIPPLCLGVFVVL